jgi:hypothetical protein
LLEQARPATESHGTFATKTNMSYYGPGFGNIQSGWYRKVSDPQYVGDRDRLDAAWNSACDEIVLRYVATYGTFFTAFDAEMLGEIEAATGRDLADTRYHCHYFSTRAWELPGARRLWLASDNEASGRIYRCSTCEATDSLTEAHPDLIHRHGINLKVCRTCDDVLRRYQGFGSSVLELVPCLMRSRKDTRKCELCGDAFDLRCGSCINPGGGVRPVDVIYPNLFVPVCPECLSGVLCDYRRGSAKTHLTRLYELFVLTGKVPTQDLGSLFYTCRDSASVLQLVRLLQKTRTAKGFADEFGSFFGALVASGILPDGSRKMLVGTMVLAKDGHVCLSIPEKEIDDFLSYHKLAHDKEVRYPGCNLRCDWEVFAEPSRRVFVEYFGLMGNRDYARRAQEKMEVAQRAGIELIELYPDADWAGKLAARFRLTNEAA